MPGFNIPLDIAGTGLSATRCADGTQEPVAIASQSQYPSNVVEAARAHRWKLEVIIPTLANTIKNRTTSDATKFTSYIKTCQRPSFEVDLITIHNQAEEIYRPGKYRWNPIDITFYEVVGSRSSLTNKTASELHDWWKSSTALNHSQASVSSINSARLVIYELTGSGEVIRTYTLYGCKLIKNSPSDLDHTTSEINTTTVSVRYDYAIETEPGDT
jgi:hypothetical protein